MIPERMGESSRKMTQGQLPKEQELQIIREDSQHFDSATYILAGGFKMVATKYGVSFAGSCSSLKPKQVKRLRVYMTRAVRIHEELAESRGLVPEAEFGDIRLRGKKGEGDIHIAWYEGRYDQRVEHTDAKAAVRTLRLNWITLYGAPA